MKAKDFLNQAYLLDQRIKSKSEQITSLNELAISCSSNITGMPRNPNGGGSKMADAVCKIIDLKNEIADDMNKLIETKKEITCVINEVPDMTLRTLLEKRYLCGNTWEEITLCLNCQRRWTFKLHGRALEVVQKILDKKF